MKTPWGDIVVSDAHVHFLSAGFFDTLERQKGAPIRPDLEQLGIQRPERDAIVLAEQWIDELNRNSVESAALIASVPADEDSVMAAVHLFPHRFFGYSMVDPTRPDTADRVRRMLDGGVQGFCFFPAMHRYSMHDEQAGQLVEVISDHPKTLIFVHCGVLSVGIRSRLKLPSRFDMRFSNPVDVHALALRFPEQPFVIPHFGAGYFRESLMLADLCPNVYFDTSSSNSWIKYESSPIELRDVFRRSLALLGSHRLLFGTDSSIFPRGWHRAVFDSQVALLAELGISAEDAQRIFGGNLRRTLA